MQARLRRNVSAVIRAAYISIRCSNRAAPVLQARLWNNVSIVVHMHGATLGNWAWLPYKAVAVHVVPNKGGFWVGGGYSSELVGGSE